MKYYKWHDDYYGDLIMQTTDGVSAKVIWLKGRWKANKIGDVYSSKLMDWKNGCKEITESEAFLWMI